MIDDRRAVIEAAFEAAEQNNEAPESPKVTQSPEVPPEASAPTESTEATSPPSTEVEGEGAAKEKQVTPAEEVTAEKLVDDAPQAWKAPLKAKWATVDPEVRQEVLRREREITRTLSETATARQLATQMREITAPFAARLQTMGINPLVAFNNMLAADHQLATGSKQTRAQLVAKLIKDYDVDIGTLDEVLAGHVSPEAREEARLAKLLEQQLAPVKQKLQTYEQREQEEARAQESAFEQEIESMATDRQKFPYFEQVRDAMADLIEISTRRGVSLDLKTAYNRAVAADPQLSAQLDSIRQREQLQQVALKAQQAKAASSSVNGAPAGALARSNPLDRRATIAAAFDALGN